MSDDPFEPAPADATPPATDQEPAAAQAAAAALEEELAALKDRHLRLAADFDNFRKRAAKERGDASEKAQGELVLRLADALDDLARFAEVDPEQTDAGSLHAGVELVERKVWKELTALGVARIDQAGVPFDPREHEAVTTAPAPTPDADHTVGAILQAGYRLGQALLRPARVQVLTWREDGAEAGT